MQFYKQVIVCYYFPFKTPAITTLFVIKCIGESWDFHTRFNYNIHGTINACHCTCFYDSHRLTFCGVNRVTSWKFFFSVDRFHWIKPFFSQLFFLVKAFKYHTNWNKRHEQTDSRVLSRKHKPWLKNNGSKMPTNLSAVQLVMPLHWKISTSSFGKQKIQKHKVWLCTQHIFHLNF